MRACSFESSPRSWNADKDLVRIIRLASVFPSLAWEALPGISHLRVGTACVKTQWLILNEEPFPTLLLHGVSSGMPVTHGDGDVDSVMHVREHTEPGRCILIGEMHKSTGNYIYIYIYLLMWSSKQRPYKQKC